MKILPHTAAFLAVAFLGAIAPSLSAQGSAILTPGIGFDSPSSAGLGLLPTTPLSSTPADARCFLFDAPLENFSKNAYAATVSALFDSFASKTSASIAPGTKAKVGIKIYTASGPGAATPKNLVRAVIAEFEKRGFARQNILIVDLHEKRIRESGYLPRLRTEGENFEGCPVIALDSERYYSRQWYYENPLPSREVFARQGDYNLNIELLSKQSFLPVPLFNGVDFWINLPVALDSPALGVSGALGNATIWNISNQRRFLDNPSNAQKAAVEIAAIPEIQRTLMFHLVSLERYQYVGGPMFDSNYCLSEQRLWLSANPLILDFLLYKRMNAARAKRGLPLIEPEPVMFIQGNTPPILLGSCRPSELELVQPQPHPLKK
ncbi:MAG: DUF362 domain-containing protein [Puniceicoccales bacterium]|jgi:hypothetical protein|nr:DUF362 domain-containing protein [Puniceicoccales bacterium]